MHIDPNDWPEIPRPFLIWSWDYSLGSADSPAAEAGSNYLLADNGTDILTTDGGDRLING